MTRPRIIIAGCSRRLRSHDASENSERHQPLIEKPLPQTSRFFPGRRGDYRLGWQCAGIPDRLRDHRDLLILGPVCGYSDTWQLTINTGTSIITLLIYNDYYV